MSEIHLQVVAGLANRMQALVSGICLAEDYGLPLIVHWSIDHACAAVFDSLFDPQSLPSFVKVTPHALLKAFPCMSPQDLEHVKKVWDHKKPLTLKSYAHFHTSDTSRWLKYLRLLQPTSKLLQEVEFRLPPFDQSRFLGVHIRRGDNEKSIQGSPYSAFLKYLEEDDSFLVVATDDEEVRDDLKKRFPSRVWFPAKVRNRHTEEGIQEAVIDFFCLIRCPKILGSVASSFTELASLYAGNKLVLAT